MGSTGATTASRPGAPARGAAWLNTVVKLCAMALSFLLVIALARSMSPEQFADVAVILAWLALATAVAGLSLPLVVVRFVPQYLASDRAQAARGVIRFSLATTSIASVAIALVASALIGSGLLSLPRDVSGGALVAAAIIVPNVALLILAGVLQGLKRAVAAEVLTNTLRPLVAVAVLGVLWWTGLTPLRASTALLVYLGATIAGLLACAGYLALVGPARVIRGPASYARREWAGSAAGFMGVMVAAAMHERIDVLLIAWMAEPAEVATYAVATRFSQALTAAASAATAVMVPHFMEQFREVQAGRRKGAQSLVSTTARTWLLLSLASLVAFWFAGHWLIGLFGPDYAGAYAPLLILTAGLVVAAAFGPAIVVASFAGETWIAVASLLAGIVVNTALNVSLVPWYGAKGAATATATAVVITALLAWHWTRRHIGLNTSIAGERFPAAG